eukprot:11164370-Lingulodinium_polyedra.AAC.1
MAAAAAGGPPAGARGARERGPRLHFRRGRQRRGGGGGQFALRGGRFRLRHRRPEGGTVSPKS